MNIYETNNHKLTSIPIGSIPPIEISFALNKTKTLIVFFIYLQRKPLLISVLI